MAEVWITYSVPLPIVELIKKNQSTIDFPATGGVVSSPPPLFNPDKNLIFKSDLKSISVHMDFTSM